jgi:hypothetical protein
MTVRATIRRDAAWGPFAYYILVHESNGGWERRGSFAWTRRGAERRAQRMIARIERKNRWHAEQWQVPE